jgi:hypothetical protein
MTFSRQTPRVHGEGDDALREPGSGRHRRQLACLHLRYWRPRQLRVATKPKRGALVLLLGCYIDRIALMRIAKGAG